LELSEPTGKNDGMCQGKRYFTCKPLYGVFVRVINCKRVADSDLPSSTPPTSTVVTDFIPVSSVKTLEISKPVERSQSTGKLQLAVANVVEPKKRTITPTINTSFSRESRDNRLKCISPSPSPQVKRTGSPPPLRKESTLAVSSISSDSHDDVALLPSLIKQVQLVMVYFIALSVLLNLLGSS
jgi:dynactin 1